jgi:hypothetical protein
MAEKRDRSYVWVTWLPELPLGKIVCCYGPWFKSPATAGLPACSPHHRTGRPRDSAGRIVGTRLEPDGSLFVAASTRVSVVDITPNGAYHFGCPLSIFQPTPYPLI